MNIHTDLENRIMILVKLGDYMQGTSPEWLEVRQLAERQNGWFTQEFINYSISQISTQFLQETILREFAKDFQTAEAKGFVKTVGITMAGNIPMVGFHDFMCVFLSGHKQKIKCSSKDHILIPHLIQKIVEWAPEFASFIEIAPMLKQCDAYIATGSNNSARYFEQYFAKYPHIIRRNRTSVAVVNGKESTAELEQLADDIHMYFGLGCRNITKIYVPQDYDFIPLLEACKKYNYFKDHNKYRNNYDYQLAIYILNHQFYMSTEGLLLVEHSSLFSPVAVLHYEFYSDDQYLKTLNELTHDIQAIAGGEHQTFGCLQTPSIRDFADGVNTIDFLNSLSLS